MRGFLLQPYRHLVFLVMVFCGMVTSVHAQDALTNPRDLTVEKVTIDSITVTWLSPISTGGSAIYAYVIYWTETETGISDQELLLSPEMNRYVITGLKPGTRYRIEIDVETNAGDFTERSDVTLLSRTLSLPPRALMFGDVTASSIEVRWDAPANIEEFPITTYTVSWGVDLADPTNPSTAASVPASMTNYVIRGLDAGTRYQIAVTGMSDTVISQRSDILTAMTQAGPPTAPRELTVVGRVTTDSITISWKSPASTGGTGITITGYTVSWREALDDNSNVFVTTTVLGSVRGHVIKGLNAGRRYQIAVVAVSSMQRMSPLSEIFSPTLSLPPRSLISGDVTASSIEVRWDAPADETRLPPTTYTVFWGTDLADPTNPSTVVSVPASMMRYVITGLDAGMTYQVAVMARTRIGTSQRSDILTTMTREAPPAAPRELTLGRATTDSITISWKRPASTGGADITIAGYIVSWREVLDGANEFKTTTVSSSAESHVIEGLNIVTSYQITVAAVNSQQSPGPHSEILSRTLSRPPKDLMLEGVTTSSIEISWKAPTQTDGVEITAYIIYWNALGRSIASELSTIVDVAPTDYVIRGLDVHTRYQIAVAAMSRDGFVGMRIGPLVVPTLGLATMVAQTISAGSGHSCAVYNGAARCWGSGDYGRLGNSPDAISFEPVAVAVHGLQSGVTAIAAGEFHSCAIQDGAAKCWGNNRRGQLGNGSPQMRSLTPVAVRTLDGGVTAISAGLWHSCAIQRGVAKCWGRNRLGQLGDGFRTDQSKPVAVRTLDGEGGVTSISAGVFHSCAIQRGSAQCWGTGNEGRLGNNSTVAVSSAADSSAIVVAVAVAVYGLQSGVTAISAGGNHSCAVVDATAQCWGQGRDGQLGNTTTRNSPRPVLVSGLNSGVTAISAGGFHSCAIQDGEAKCWGNNTRGQLGNGSSQTRSLTPVAVDTLDGGVTAISAGVWHSCAIHYGFIKCWGSNSRGQLGDNRVSGNDADVPVQAQDLNPLAAPSQLMTSAITTESITISWTASMLAENIPITTYTVSWGTDLANPINPITAASVSARMTSYVITGLDVGTSYQIMVTAMNRGGTGQRSEVLMQITQAEPPSALRELTLGRVTTNSIEVSWLSPDSAGGADITITGYTVSWREVVDGTNEFKTTRVSGLAGSHPIDELNDGTEYQIAVVAVNSMQLMSSRSEIFSPTLPLPPRSLMFGDVTTSSIAVHWDAPADETRLPATTYTVSWGIDLADPTNPSTAVSVPSSMTSYVITDLDAGTRYQIVVTAMNRGGTGPRSDILTTMTQVVPPTAPRELTLGRVTTASITISWKRPASTGGADITITGYTVSWREVVDGGTNEFKTTRVLGSVRSHVIKGLNAGTEYQIAVVAVNSMQLMSPRSEIFSPTLSLPPRSLMFGDVTTSSIEVRWDAPADETRLPPTAYTVFWGTDLADPTNPSTAASVPSSMMRYVITGLDAGTIYQVAVIARNRIGTSQRSDILTTMTQEARPTAPKELTLGRVTTDSIAISWKPPASTGGADITITGIYCFLARSC